jgi:hypothetical protein
MKQAPFNFFEAFSSSSNSSTGADVNLVQAGVTVYKHTACCVLLCAGGELSNDALLLLVTCRASTRFGRSLTQHGCLRGRYQALVSSRANKTGCTDAACAASSSQQILMQPQQQQSGHISPECSSMIQQQQHTVPKVLRNAFACWS